MDADTAVPVSFALDPARAGWIGLTVTAGGVSDRIHCSDVYDPFQDIADFMLRLAHGGNGCVEIDEEGRSTLIWIDREPGSRTGRLRVFEPGGHGEVEALRIDAAVDVAHMAEAYLAAFTAYAASYDASQWGIGNRDRAPRDRTLAAIDTRWLASALSGIREARRRESLPARSIPATPA